jgi:hypothetical protein
VDTLNVLADAQLGALLIGQHFATPEPVQEQDHVRVVAVGEVDGTTVAVSGDDNGAILLWALDRDQCASARIDAGRSSCDVLVGRARCLTAVSDGKPSAGCEAFLVGPGARRTGGGAQFEGHG